MNLFEVQRKIELIYLQANANWMLIFVFYKILYLILDFFGFLSSLKSFLILNKRLGFNCNWVFER